MARKSNFIAGACLNTSIPKFPTQQFAPIDYKSTCAGESTVSTPPTPILSFDNVSDPYQIRDSHRNSRID